MATTRAFRKTEAERFYLKYFPSRLGELDFIDWNYSVRDVPIPKGATLYGFKDPRVSPLKTTFFCLPGTPVAILGVHERTNLKTHPKVLPKTMNEYLVLVAVPHALESVCADGLDGWSLQGSAKKIVPVAGGGWQYKIPEPQRHLRHVPETEIAARLRTFRR